jgi:diacylglycerol kinase (ATP)
MRRRFLIIHNTRAGLRQRWLLAAVLRHLEQAGAAIRVADAASLDEDEKIARSAVAAGDYDCVVAAGGDSTIRGVACGLIGSRMPLGIIPIGTGNVLAHEIGLGRDPASLAKTLREGPALDIRYGRADAVPFLMMVGAGFDAHVVGSLNTSWKRNVGKLAYSWPTVRALLRRPNRFEVAIDGRTMDATWLVVTRVAHYAGAFVIADRQGLSDDGFHAIVTTVESRRGLMSVLISMARRRHALRRDVEIVACKHVTLPGSPELATQLDGERVSPSVREIALSDDTLAVIVPRASALGTTVPSSDRSR